MPYGPLQLSDTERASLLDNPSALVGLCNVQRFSLPTSPAQSHFRVFAIILFSTPDVPGSVLLVEGTNSEPWHIGGSICAERSCLVKLRFFTAPRILQVAITTDSPVPVGPGMLCREYLMSMIPCSAEGPAAIVILGDCTGQHIVSCTVESLFPQPYIYRGIGRKNLAAFGESFAAAKISPKPHGGWEDESMRLLYATALSACQNDGHAASRELHPISLAAAVMFDDGSMSVAWLLKGLEYGCSLDPVAQLVGIMVSKSTIRPMYLIFTDQFGICHAPHAQARALLTEHGFASAPIILIHGANGECMAVTAEALSPPPPGLAEGVSAAFIDKNCK